MEVLCWAMASPIFQGAGASPNMYYTSRTSFPHPDFCYELSMVCALMACYVLESSECGSSGQSFIRASVCSR
jgi:hypothetical protein